MTFEVQHNGKGKYHLIGNDFILCKSFGIFNYTKSDAVLLLDGNFYEQIGTMKLPIFKDSYCKKCLKKALLL